MAGASQSDHIMNVIQYDSIKMTKSQIEWLTTTGHVTTQYVVEKAGHANACDHDVDSTRLVCCPAAKRMTLDTTNKVDFKKGLKAYIFTQSTSHCSHSVPVPLVIAYHLNIKNSRRCGIFCCIIQRGVHL